MSKLRIAPRGSTILEQVIKIGNPDMTSEQIRDAREKLEDIQVTYSIVDKIMEERQVGRRRAQQIVRAQNHAAIDEESIPMTNKTMVLETLYRSGSIAGEGLYSHVKAMGSDLRMPEVLSVVWALQKQGWVTFRERHTAHGSILQNIKLTPAGRTKAIELRGGTPAQATERAIGPSSRQRGYSASPRAGATHSAGIDGTNYRNHRKTAVGGPIEIIRPADPVASPEVVGPISQYIAQNAESATQDAQSAAQLEDRGESVTYDDSSHMSMASPDMGMTSAGTQVGGIDLHEYPLIADLVLRAGRFDKLEAAARLMDESDEAELAMAILDKIKISDLEKEVLRLLASLR